MVGPIAIVIAAGLMTASCAWGLDIALDGRAVAQIIIPDNPLPVVTFAADELNHHIAKSTGVSLVIKSENEIGDNSMGAIYLGPCQKSAEVKISAEELPPNAFHIKLTGGNLFMIGKDSDGRVIGCRTYEYSLHDNKVRVGTLFAVYEFLERRLGVRWLWPGEDGEVIPKHKNISVAEWDQTHIPQIIHGRIRDYYNTVMQKDEGWARSDARDKFCREQAVWMRRHRLAQGVDIDYGHGFTDYWEKYGKSHPEYFAKRSDGKREPAGRPEHVQLCLSQSALWRRIVEGWGGSDSYINCWENDRTGKDHPCSCERCRAWDVPGTGSLTDRYCRFLLAVQKEARKVRLDAKIIAGAYGHTATPPETRLNEDMLIGIVPGLYFPWTDEAFDRVLSIWDGWSNTGAKLYMRPNFFHFGHNVPINISRKFGEFFSHVYARNLVITDFDQIGAPYANQGPALYVQARMHHRGDWPVDRILDEYFCGFGKAEAEVRAYFDHWEEVTHSDATVEAYQTSHKSPLVIPAINDNPEHRIYRWSELFIPDEVVRKGRALLETAKQVAKGDPVSEERVEFLRMGLRDYELTRAVSYAFRAYKQGGDVNEYATALRRLDQHRASVEDHNVANMGYLRYKEFLWDRGILNRLPSEQVVK